MSGQSQKLAKWSLVLLATASAMLSTDLNQARAQQSQTENTESTGFKTQQGTLDLTPLPDQDKPAAVKPQVLNGQVSHSASLPQPEQDNGAAQSEMPPKRQATENNGTATVDLGSLIDMMQRNKARNVFTSLFSATIRTDANGQTFTLHNRRPNLSPEYFRKLNYGVIGLTLISFLDGRQSVITGVYPTCPAALAGIAPGDIMYEANGYRFKPGDDQRILWQVCAGKADTPIDVTVIRRGQPITFHLTRMNIEDIQDTRVRTQYEMLLSAFGAPQQ